LLRAPSDGHCGEKKTDAFGLNNIVRQLSPKMKHLRVAAFVTLLGGLIVFFRTAQALEIEIAYQGPHYLKFTIPLFLIRAGISATAIFCAVSFFKTPTKTSASRVARASIFSLWLLLASFRPGIVEVFYLLIGCLIYSSFLKPAVISQFGPDEEPAQALEPAAPSGRSSA
jgi:hypothetical protein